ncbi:hypothetical protein [Hyalangium rubrum]|uniref:Lipoprotein n=1 Tax=Hyalangium rubrum TaxID=3103134 RepID=A0ABU5GVV5_9BACT|nr:hypothetical protein [Hyalangium sp. s54d21]MDY7225305.1 hypothetical protein [Hyalangium sp. s54d21]
MKRAVVAALAAGAWLVGCGGGGSLPPGEQPVNPGGPVALPGTPETPGEENKPTVTQSLWPLTTGSTWTYLITDPNQGTFHKTVEVKGPSEVPNITPKMTGVLVHSRQARATETYEEQSWQLELTNGLVVRLREEDIQDGIPIRATTWTTASGTAATVKSISREQAMTWKHADTITEWTRMGDGSQDSKERTYEWTVLAVNDTVSTPAGTFTNAIKLQRRRLDKQSKDRTYWLVPGIGKVKETGERDEELVSFDIKK